ITLVRIALADVHGWKVGLKGGDLEFVETPAPALPAALAAGRIDAGTLIHAQAFKAQQTGEFRSIAEVAGDLTKKFNLRMISAVLAGYGEKLDKDPDLYLAALDLIKRSSQYAVKNAKEVFAAAGKQTNTDPDFFQTWFTRYSEFPAELIKQDVAAIELLYKKSVELDLMKSYPPMSEMVWNKVAAN
ncbi:MAG: MqnA/MqnD/SBP family protein, partial [Devosia sp.]